MKAAFDQLPIDTLRSLFRSAPFVDERSVWIQRFVASGTRAKLDVFTDGRFSGTVHLPPDVKLLAVQMKRLLVVRADEGEDRWIEEYAVRWR